MSAMHKTPESFFLARFRRIIPAYVFMLAATALILSPVIYSLTFGSVDGFSWIGKNGALLYVISNATMSVDVSYVIDGVFSSNPFVSLNGSIWVMPVEFRAYVIALLVVVIGQKVGLTRTAVTALFIALCLMVLNRIDPVTAEAILPEFLPPGYMQWLFIFLCGSVLATLADRIVLTHERGVTALLLFLASSQLQEPLFSAIGLGTLVIVIPYLASLLPTRPFRWFTNDLSFGTFLWGFPVAQVLAFAGLNSLGLAPFALLSVLCTLPFAAVSWFLVERRFLKRSAPAKDASARS
jgi:peptidoglycan/LPS O-acetylase OafA/YrhL